MKVLFPIEGSPLSAVAVQSVIKRDWQQDTEFLVVCVQEPISYNFAVPPSEACVNELEKLKSELYIRLNEVASSAARHISQEAGCSAESRVVQGRVVESLMEVAKDWNANLIVVGSPLLAALLAEHAGDQCDVEALDTRLIGEAERTSE